MLNDLSVNYKANYEAAEIGLAVAGAIGLH